MPTGPPKVPTGTLRDHPNHRERGPKTFLYTYRDLARLFGTSVAGARQAAYRGSYDPSDLASVCRYYHQRNPGEMPDAYETES